MRRMNDDMLPWIGVAGLVALLWFGPRLGVLLPLLALVGGVYLLVQGWQRWRGRSRGEITTYWRGRPVQLQTARSGSLSLRSIGPALPHLAIGLMLVLTAVVVL
ncbi:MAG: hypothetical protein MUD01_26020 [Chloroflexaceae bacterium]|nr:hypothetical protein [Chloroflexaceae bacterium]